MFTKKEIRRLVIPMLFEQALAQMVGMADTVMVAQAGEAAVSAVSLIDSINLLILYFIGALSTGGAIVLSHAIGAKKNDRIRDVQKQLFWISIIISVAISLIIAFFHSWIITLVYGSISQEIMVNAKAYFFYTALSLPFLAIRNAVGACYRAFGNSKVSLYTSLLTNVINIGGNALMIFGFGMGAKGAAIATLFSRMIGAIIMIVLVMKRNQPVYIEKLLRFKPDFKIIGKILGIGLPNAFEGSAFQLGKVLTQSVVSTFGDIAIAANATANTLTSMSYIPGTAISGAITTIVGRCVGAQEEKEAIRYTKKLVGTTYLIIWALTIGMGIFISPLVGMFKLSAEGHSLAVNLFLFHSVCVCTIWPIAFTLPSAFRAACDVRFTMIISIVSMWIFRVGGSFFFAKVIGMGVFGVWLGMLCDWVFRGTIFAIRFLRGKWLQKYKS